MKKKSNYDPSIHHRRSIRLRGWDYGKPGNYFITICCQDKVCLFGEVVQGKMILNQAGKIAQECWLAIPQHYPNTTLHEFIIMPNHVHGIIEIISKNTDSNQEKNEIKGLDMDIHHGLDMDNHHGLDMDIHHGLDMDIHHGLDMDIHHGLDMDIQHGFDMDIHHGLDIDIHHGLDMDIHHGLDMDIHHGLDMDIHHGLDMAGGNVVVGNAGGNDNSPLHSPQPFNNYNSSPHFKSPSKTIGSIVRGFKIGVTKWMRQNTNVYHVWQRDYYDDIIWDSQKYNRIAKYIIDNLLKWGKKKGY